MWQVHTTGDDISDSKQIWRTSFDLTISAHTHTHTHTLPSVWYTTCTVHFVLSRVLSKMPLNSGEVAWCRVLTQQVNISNYCNHQLPLVSNTVLHWLTGNVFHFVLLIFHFSRFRISCGSVVVVTCCPANLGSTPAGT